MIKIETYDYEGYVYDINMTNHHNFFANGFCVHNCGKKRYALNVWDVEGVRYSEPTVKVTGLETNKSSTPEVVRDALMDSLRILLGGTQNELREYIASFETKFRSLPVEDIAFPRSVNNVEKYTGPDGMPMKGCPGHVKAAITFNRHVAAKHPGLYQPISSGEKIKFVYMVKENPYRAESFGFVGKPPKEVEIAKFVDLDVMFEKTYLKPLEAIAEAVKWQLIDRSSLDDFFS